MIEKDSLQRFIFENAPVRGEFIRLDEAYQTIINQHPYPEPIRRLLGEALCVAGLLSAIIKFDGRLTVQFRGEGKLRLLLAQCDQKLQMRALVKWDGDSLDYPGLMQSFEKGVLVITLDSGGKTAPYQGIVAWRGNSIIESIQGYFQESEQLPTRIFLSVNKTSAAGLLLQVVPAADRKSRAIEESAINPHWMRITKLTGNLDPMDLLNMPYQSLLQYLYPEEEVRIFHPVPVTFNCNCSRKRGEDAILVLGRKEAEEELKDRQSIVVTCDFCNTEYVFDRVDVAAIFESRGAIPPDKHLH